MGAESVAASLGVEAPPDLVEGLCFQGYQTEDEGWTLANAEAECPWIDSDWFSHAPLSLRKASLAYWCGQLRLLEVMMELAATALDLPPDYFVTEGG